MESFIAPFIPGFKVLQLSSRAGCPQSFIHSECKTCCAVSLYFDARLALTKASSLSQSWSARNSQTSGPRTCARLDVFFKSNSPSSLNNSSLLLHFSRYSGAKDDLLSKNNIIAASAKPAGNEHTRGYTIRKRLAIETNNNFGHWLSESLVQL